MAKRGMEANVKSGTSPNERMEVQIRWLIRRDMPEVLRIEQASFGSPWSDEDFLCCLRQRNCIGMVAEHDQKIFGFMIYELHKSRLHILNFAVAPEVRKQTVGAQMILRLVDKLSQQRRNEIILEVRESNLEAQLFFRKQNFKAVCVLRRHFDDTEEDGYIMQFKLNAEMDEAAQFAPHNRISQISEFDVDAA